MFEELIILTTGDELDYRRKWKADEGMTNLDKVDDEGKFAEGERMAIVDEVDIWRLI